MCSPCACHWTSSCWYGLCAYYILICLFYVLPFRWLCVIVLTLEVADWSWLTQEMTVEAGKRTSFGLWVLMNDGLWAGTSCWLYRCAMFLWKVSQALYHRPLYMCVGADVPVHGGDVSHSPSILRDLSRSGLRRQTTAARIGVGK